MTTYTIKITEEQLELITTAMSCPSLYNLKHKPCIIGSTKITCYDCQKNALLTANKEEVKP